MGVVLVGAVVAVAPGAALVETPDHDAHDPRAGLLSSSAAFVAASRVETPAWLTSSTPSAQRATAAGSATASSGGVSMMTQSAHSSSESMTSFILVEPSSSLGFGGILPDVSTSSCASPGRWSAAFRECAPSSTSDRPMKLLTLKNSWVVDRRKSDETRTTFLPAFASAAARFAETVDLPSPGAAEVTTIVFMSPWKFMKSSELRTTRYASAAAEPGSLEDHESPLVALLHLVDRDRPEHGRAEDPLGFVRRADGVVQVLAQEGHADAEHQPDREPERRCCASGWGETGSVLTAAASTTVAPPVSSC